MNDYKIEVEGDGEAVVVWVRRGDVFIGSGRKVMPPNWVQRTVFNLTHEELVARAVKRVEKKLQKWRDAENVARKYQAAKDAKGEKLDFVLNVPVEAGQLITADMVSIRRD